MLLLDSFIPYSLLLVSTPIAVSVCLNVAVIVLLVSDNVGAVFVIGVLSIFTKMEGLGNDYIIFDCTKDLKIDNPRSQAFDNLSSVNFY